MQIRDLLHRDHIFVPLEGPTLREALARMVTGLASQGSLADPTPVLDRIQSETMRDVVAVSSRVVLPHYRTPAVDAVVLALGVASEPLNAREAGLDARPRVVVLVLAPSEAANLYLQTLSSLARLLRADSVVDALLACHGPDDVLSLDQLGELPIRPTLAVRDVMLTRVEAIPPDTPVRDAVNLMIRRRMRAVPVVGEKGEVLGLVSDRDIMRALLPMPRAGDEPGGPGAVRPAEILARDIMTRSVLCIAEELALTEAATMMVNKDINVLPVVSEGALTGLITRGEIIRKLFGP